ncbi:adenylyl-sulfate reductase [Candidatus Thiosymbion oneisti]|uniref:adenylyl-sulfate reductase n=1 Tax=Candidatus Thiosymbion oneisti TaxID=589554 RepID=UPI001C4018D2|nr:adenylyl-sulfate reductase [Candidatus Thiosymbion oneisti]
MQAYVVAMFLLVIAGTVLDMIHKKSAQYFFEHAQKAQRNAKRTVSGSEKTSLLLKTIASEVLTSAELANPRRRISHLFTMYGFITFIVTTAILVFAYPTPADQAPTILSVLWHLGALMLCFGGYWFWFFIRVDVSSEGHPWYRLVRADLFIVSLLATATFALIWSAFQAMGTSGSSGLSIFFFALFILSGTVLFGTVLWSKFAHMFFKPAAAYQKRLTKADGSRENLPELADRTNPADRDRHSMELLKDAPLHMGLGIEREAPRHY